MRRLILALGSSSLVALLACGDDTSSGPSDASTDHAVNADGATLTDTGNGNPDTGGGKDSGEAGPTLPPPPTLGAQIDRMGRPAINTALTGTFDPACTAASCPAKDAYNADNVLTHWASYVPGFETYLAIYDGLDGVCGNQAAYGALDNPGYATLATVLSGDVLWVNTANSTCAEYLGVELDALGATNTDCGGRTLTENVIDVTYNAVAGTLGTGTNVTNGITAPASAPGTTFPYLASPH